MVFQSLMVNLHRYFLVLSFDLFLEHPLVLNFLELLFHYFVNRISLYNKSYECLVYV